MSELVQDYSHCLRRIRACRQPIRERSRQSDIEKILFSRCQEDDYDPDALYALFSSLTYEQVTEIYDAIREQQRHVMPEGRREGFLQQYLPGEFAEFYNLMTDFRCSGYRILGNLICDCMDAYRLETQKNLHSEADSPAMEAMLEAYRASTTDYKTAVAAACRKHLETIVSPKEAVKYAVAVGDKDFLWDVLYDRIYDHVKRGGDRNAE